MITHDAFERQAEQRGADALREYEKRHGALLADCAYRGQLDSGRRWIQAAEIGGDVGEELARALLADLDHAVVSGAPRNRCCETAFRVTIQFMQRAQKAAEPKQSFGGPPQTSAVRARFAEATERVRAILKRHEDGFPVGANSAGPSTTNTVTIAGPNYGPVQQGGQGNTQTATQTFDVAAAAAALKRFADQLSGFADTEVLADLQAEIATLRLEMGKRRPSLSIVREAGRALRSMTEGVAAGLLTPPAAAAALALWSALPLG